MALRVVALLLLFDIKNVFFSFSSKGKQHPYIIVIDEHRRLTAGVIMSSEKKVEIHVRIFFSIDRTDIRKKLLL